MPHLAAWSFQAAAQSGGTQVETSGLPELRRQSLEPWKATVAKGSRTEYQREENWREERSGSQEDVLESAVEY